MNFFQMPPVDDPKSVTKFLVYEDRRQGFKRTSMMGVDILLLITDAMVLNAADLVFKNTALSLMVLMLYQYIIVWFRNYFGEDNISKKTLIDERFLI